MSDSPSPRLVANLQDRSRRAGVRPVTLTRFTIEQEHRHDASRPTGEFSGLLNAVATAIKVIANTVSRGALATAAGSAASENVHGEVQHQLDLLSNEVMIAQTEWTGHLAAMVSEELSDVRVVPPCYRRGKYLLVFDPLDGSSNIDVNLSVGTIFSILRNPRRDTAPTASDFLQPGTEQVCAGFALYGPATVLVLTTGDGVNGFTLDRDIGAFVLTHPDMRIPTTTSEFAINASNERFWEPPVRRYVRECLAGRNGPRAQDTNMRWVASLVADTFRILTRGGVFLYPADTKEPARAGRLRLLYEANPIAFIVEQAGGLASTGRQRILEVTPRSIHDRVPLVFGSRSEVKTIERYHRAHDEGREPTSRLDQPRQPERFDASLFNTRTLFRR
jgi:fructose-1,6-bisphosphatase I/sedoheptulose-1,7-bisphosphatase